MRSRLGSRPVNKRKASAAWNTAMPPPDIVRQPSLRTAEYFQVYTTTLESGLFFEIVERRGYAGFGAVNAPIRLATQSRLTRTTPY